MGTKPDGPMAPFLVGVLKTMEEETRRRVAESVVSLVETKLAQGVPRDRVVEDVAEELRELTETVEVET